MRKIYNKISLKSFRLSSAALFVLGDFSIGYYLYQTLNEYLVFMKKSPIFQAAFEDAIKKSKMPIPPGFREDFFELIAQGILFFFTLIFLFNIFMNVFYLFEKRFAYLYFRFLSFCFGFLSITFFIKEITVSYLYGPLFLVITLGYVFNFSGFFYFPILRKAKKTAA